jgi:hypothetical protein
MGTGGGAVAAPIGEGRGERKERGKEKEEEGGHG